MIVIFSFFSLGFKILFIYILSLFIALVVGLHFDPSNCIRDFFCTFTSGTCETLPFKSAGTENLVELSCTHIKLFLCYVEPISSSGFKSYVFSIFFILQTVILLIIQCFSSIFTNRIFESLT